jgi:hypothetical protein
MTLPCLELPSQACARPDHQCMIMSMCSTHRRLWMCLSSPLRLKNSFEFLPSSASLRGNLPARICTPHTDLYLIRTVSNKHAHTHARMLGLSKASYLSSASTAHAATPPTTPHSRARTEQLDHKGQVVLVAWVVVAGLGREEHVARDELEHHARQAPDVHARVILGPNQHLP